MSEAISLEAIEDIARQYGYWAVFFGISLENAGLPLPGETLTLVGGFLAGEGELDYWIVLLCATGGAILGDNFGYWIGKWGGFPLMLRIGKLLRVPEGQLYRLRDEFSKNAAKAVFLGRFVALLRIFAGPLAGISDMPYGKFFLCNAAGATVWASVMVSLSFFVGRLVPLEKLVSGVATFSVGALLLVVLAIAIPRLLELRNPLNVEEK
ncbi:DedA family protein [Geitlerinema sp. P-1104]|uniref:DedA family protein n=1 Tax=Geitlerinema sp. P-1104 TaxID=2546230 RepID=UPI001476EE3B|nr:DedA family protein [Geitlerinema sp. P-1104]NMG57125.1 DedA family protein [Geitlerinema sp. P-1104]